MATSRATCSMELSINDLGVVREAVLATRAKWYDIGLALNVPVHTLDSIRTDCEFTNHSDKLRETLKVWLKTATKPMWQDILNALRSPVIGESILAIAIEGKQAKEQVMPAVQQPTTRDTHVQLQTLQQELLQTKDQLQNCQVQIRQLTQQVKEKQQMIDDRAKQLGQLQQQLKKQKQANQELRVANDQLRGELQEDKQDGQLKTIREMRWQKESKAPEKMYRGSTGSDLNVAYFTAHGSTKVHSYDSGTRIWCRLPDTPHINSTIAVTQHTLTVVGGKLVSGEATNSILSLRNEKWLADFPAMPTKRYFTAVACSDRSLIVAGGKDGSNTLTTVEVLDTVTRQWFIAGSLPHPFELAITSICGKRLYILGGYCQIHKPTRSVFTCSITELLQSCQPQPLAGKLQMAPAKQSTVWQNVADAPHLVSSSATLCGKLVVVGGWEDSKVTAAIGVYNEKTNSWETVGHMPTARDRALVAVLSGKKMIVVGGRVSLVTETDVVETFSC